MKVSKMALNALPNLWLLLVDKEHILKFVTCLVNPEMWENPFYSLCTIAQAASQANVDQNVWVLPHPSVSTALMRPSGPKQCFLQLVIYLLEVLECIFLRVVRYVDEPEEQVKIKLRAKI